MAAGSSRRIVVDASVARSAGGEDAAHGTAQSCRDVLLSIRSAGLRIALSIPIREEWHRHQSRFARKWLVSMYSRKRAEQIDHDPPSDLLAVIGNALAGDVQPIVAKDFLLIDAALKTDGRIVSLDHRTLNHLKGICETIPALRFLFWGIADAVCIQWLTDGAPDMHLLRICPLVVPALE